MFLHTTHDPSKRTPSPQGRKLNLPDENSTGWTPFSERERLRLNEWVFTPTRKRKIFVYCNNTGRRSPSLSLLSSIHRTGSGISSNYLVSTKPEVSDKLGV